MLNCLCHDSKQMPIPQQGHLLLVALGQFCPLLAYTLCQNKDMPYKYKKVCTLAIFYCEAIGEIINSMRKSSWLSTKEDHGDSIVYLMYWITWNRSIYYFATSCSMLNLTHSSKPSTTHRKASFSGSKCALSTYFFVVLTKLAAPDMIAPATQLILSVHLVRHSNQQATYNSTHSDTLGYLVVESKNMSQQSSLLLIQPHRDGE